MRSADADTVAYLTARKGTITARFLWLIAKDRTTGADETAGFWNGTTNVTVQVISGQTGLPETRTYVGAGSLIAVDDINLVSDLTVQTVRIKMSQSNDAVNNAIRGYDARNAKCEIHYLLFDLATELPVGLQAPHFVGEINKAPITRAKVNSSGGVQAEAVSRTRELTIGNPAKRSDETQRVRGGGSDRFRKYSGTAGQWSIWWGEDKKNK